MRRLILILTLISPFLLDASLVSGGDDFCDLPTLIVCGDGCRDVGEECDDGNNVTGDGCSCNCHLEFSYPTCGNGICEWGEPILKGATACMSDCCDAVHCWAPTPDPGPPFCGDCIVQGPEECDDANTEEGDGCNNICRRTCDYELPLKCPSSWTATVPGGIPDDGLTGNYEGHDIAVDGEDNVYVVGATMVESAGGFSDQHVLVTKYDRCGGYRWADSFAPPVAYWAYPQGITVDTEGNVYAVASGDIFSISLRKYDSCGAEEWTIDYFDPSLSVEVGQDIALDGLGNLYVSGVVYDPDISSSSFLHWVGKYSTSGSPADPPWPVTIGGLGLESSSAVDANDLAVDPTGGIYLLMEGTYDPDGLWLVKLMPDGSLDTTFGDGGWLIDEDYYGWDIDVDSFGNVYVARDNGYWSFVSFDPAGEFLLAADGVYLTPRVNRDIDVDATGHVYLTGETGAYWDSCTGLFVRKYMTDGTYLWTADDVDDTDPSVCRRGFGVAAGSDGSVYVTGTSTGSDLIIRKYNSCGTSTPGPATDQADPSCL